MPLANRVFGQSCVRVLGYPVLRAIAVLLLPSAALAQQQAVTFGGFIDAYYALDFGRPHGFDRSFTTQAARANEFNINLAFVDAVLTGDKLRGRIALQAGTAVQAAYANEPAVGQFSGGSLARHIQEATVGTRLREGLWLDAGIMLSHVGSETWVSRDNPTYTRSLIADFSPYYESGVKLTWDVRPDVTALFTIVNGWGNISENNGDKTVGGRLDWAVTPHVSIGYYNLIGNEQPDSLAGRLRLYNGITAKLSYDEITFTATFDGGREQRAGADPASWYGGSFIAHLHMTEHVSLVGRFETFDDSRQVLVKTDAPFNVLGGSLGLDVEPNEGFMWRTEVRALRGKAPVFQDRGTASGLSRSNMAVITSLSVSF
ncbi:MAG TPA: porin [Gemmatimonadaceae bacterium]|nr:porin [Gemmatimonadaceae bacterium]